MGVNVLVVDDDPSFLQMVAVTTRLESRVNEVRAAASGAEALKMCEDFAPDVAFVDSLLPRMAGEEVCNRLRKKFPTARIVSLSGVQDVSTPSHYERLEKSSSTVEDISRVVSEVAQQAE